MKPRILITLLLCIFTATTFAQDSSEDIVLEKPNLKRGFGIMETLSKRKSSREFSNKELTKADLSDLLWAANGINREDGKRTAPSAKNKQEIAVYAFLESGVYLYDFQNHTLVLVAKGDQRKLAAGRQAAVANAPVLLVYVADISKLNSFGERALTIAAMDSGIVSQNVSLFCASAGLANVPRITMDTDGIKKLLKLSQTEIPLMNNAIGYSK